MSSTASHAPRLAGRSFTPRAGSVMYVDADWIAADGDVAAALVLDERGLRYDDGPPAAVGEADSAHADVLAFAALSAMAQEAVAHVPREAAHRKVVRGQGVVAQEVRRLLGTRSATEEGAPLCVVDTTGDPDVLARSLSELEALGTFIAAGPLGGRRLDLNLYADVHARGLRVIGVAPALADGLVPDVGGDAFTPPTRAAWGTTVAAGSSWHRFEA